MYLFYYENKNSGLAQFSFLIESTNLFASSNKYDLCGAWNTDNYEQFLFNGIFIFVMN